MHVEWLKSGRWAVCEEDGTIIRTFQTKSAASQYKNFMMWHGVISEDGKTLEEPKDA